MGLRYSNFDLKIEVTLIVSMFVHCFTITVHCIGFNTMGLQGVQFLKQLMITAIMPIKGLGDLA